MEYNNHTDDFAVWGGTSIYFFSRSSFSGRYENCSGEEMAGTPPMPCAICCADRGHVDHMEYDERCCMYDSSDPDMAAF